MLRAPGLGASTLLERLTEDGSLKALFPAKNPTGSSHFHIKPETRRWLREPDEALIQTDLDWLSRDGHHLITYDHPDYPTLLKQTARPPLALWLIGDPALLWRAQVAVVGSRNPTAGGVDNAKAFSAHLSAAGMVITSGLAMGVDAAAHEAALDAGGETVAVVGTGLDRVYPARNQALARRIAKQGVLVSEYPPGTDARPGHFPARNRIIGWLSLGTLVVEAGIQSGSLITARLAAEQGREVFAIPGSIHNPMARGCHRLLRQGAKLVESGQDIVEELGPMAGRLADVLRERLDREAALEGVDPAPNIQSPAASSGDSSAASEQPGADALIEADEDYRQLWSKLGHDPQPVDRLVASSGLSAAAVSSMLLMLELQGKVEAHPGGAYSRAAGSDR